ncbi:MAG TPA: acyltransferase family protein [Jiangellales bacterium]|nr:acyltransferase family protein [Jiangellales bacterium]
MNVPTAPVPQAEQGTVPPPRGPRGPRDLPGPPGLGYRPGLDGVRGLAVLAVVAFHLGAPWLRGGFIGVDVFFVLSGFLITALLLGEFGATGRLDLPAFWARRARRLLPALLLVLLVLGAWAAWVAPPESAAALRGDALAALLYVANWRFVATGESYLATTAPSPLLHTWSLGVEEQWYLLMPLLLVAVLKLRRGRTRVLTPLLLVLAVASAALMLVLDVSGASHARVFYGSDTRVFELLLGAALAAAVHTRGLPRPRSADVAGAAGLVGLGAAAVVLTATGPALFRGGLVLVAVGAAGLVVAAATPGTITATVLGWWPLRAVGIVSYGLYLWHWPVQLFLAGSPWWIRLGLAGAIATASYVLLERPVRRGAWASLPAAVRPMVPVVAMSCVATVLVAATTAETPISVRGDLGDRVRVAPSPPVVRPDPRALPPRPEVVAQAETAEPTPVDGPLDVLVVGDSVGFSLAYHAPDPAADLYVTGEHVLGCGITEEPLVFPGGGVLERPHCAGYVTGWTTLLEQESPDVVVLVSGAWEVYDHLDDDQVLVMGFRPHDRFLAQRFRAALDVLTAGGRPVVVTDVPCFDDPTVQGGPRVDSVRVWHLNELLARVVDDYPTARLVRLSDRLCRDGTDAVGTSVRYDGVHFTAVGAAGVWPWLEGEIRRAATLDDRGALGR